MENLKLCKFLILRLVTKKNRDRKKLGFNALHGLPDFLTNLTTC